MYFRNSGSDKLGKLEMSGFRHLFEVYAQNWVRMAYSPFPEVHFIFLFRCNHIKRKYKVHIYDRLQHFQLRFHFKCNSIFKIMIALKPNSCIP